ncbi:NUDIX hydrolase [Psychrilyobacter atlanticus]|uniref:NUDIX hydrolase n=1 Tax=Psychrilyobacter atlanticus TaxID=271091 RepID=UPI0004213FCD|nr:NUDIX domain-containing protein [Psychrilyobacter atlanticus]
MEKEKFTIPAVRGIIEDNIDGEDVILIQKRFKDSKDGNGLLEIPAGKIREFEDIFTCLRREIREETGLEVIKIVGEDEAVKVVENGYCVLNYESFSTSQNIGGEYPVMVQIFLCKAKGELLRSSNESQEIQWISLKVLKEKLERSQSDFYPMHISALKKYLKMKNV